ncbi:GGDEF domain-containing protein [Sedimentibacter saalensis]|uniref:Diguanylate cyclase (GGDEF)-like protein n=1 Tax=Sedimentibacter saalensis TaxID=130788 RepID=A0A562J4S1_9FIRM|nr:GGDEF domain-containing protein [Sedimentibacter saalensis]TWH78206.1 diguanylate cyclase (GGDEF)-like protein [Sedimentibacter saalensis]
MGDKNNYDISFLCEFKDRNIEKEFLNYELKRNAKVIGPIIIIYGLVYFVFVVSDYFSIMNTQSFQFILTVRLIFLASSVLIYMGMKFINNCDIMIYLITAYEFVAVLAFLMIINQYETLTFLSILSVVAMNAAIFITPNKLINAQFISLFLNIAFFVFPANHIYGIDTSVLIKTILYVIMIVTYCNIGFYLNNYYKRKQYADSLELLRLSITDSLTGIFNRAKFNEELKKWTDYCSRYESDISLVFFDIDNFKRVNDNYGHMTGDKVIQDIVLSIQNKIRSTDIFARWGGEEFVILLPNTGNDQAAEMAERMRIAIEKITVSESENITCSFGIATLRENESSESFIKRGDKLLYEAKRRGKNIVVYEMEVLEEVR